VNIWLDFLVGTAYMNKEALAGLKGTSLHIQTLAQMILEPLNVMSKRKPTGVEPANLPTNLRTTHSDQSTEDVEITVFNHCVSLSVMICMIRWVLQESTYTT
jgi:hypothetical protein